MAGSVYINKFPLQLNLWENQMSMEELSICLLLVFVACSIALYIRMIVFLQRHGVKLGLISLRLMLPYLSKYKELYAQDKAGGANLFTYWLVCMNGTLVSAILLFLTH
ncbi:hypothetical protein CEE37_08415 [candidate division LCP-89 bacterium B3_LCP]|uniref:Uncharacterized protein n=1 Tax=candidate division LCP-89 bacterium B3_LCP TaxID=2012998 RepID=A0A532UZF8_UNCL8|nr:MAG: hypothetical protein CEE37_08415 [candidate division LCP-89 bacterium B3_LCP]